MFDTHCHLNFKVFDKTVEQIIYEAKDVGVTHIVIPGTDIETSKKAIQLAEKFENVYAAVGIHPHHIYQYQKSKTTLPASTRGEPDERVKDQYDKLDIKNELEQIEVLMKNKKVVAAGEVGIDRHYYNKTKYTDYSVDESFIKHQKEFLKRQIDLAIRYNKSLILHNREAKKDLISVLKEKWDKKLAGRTVFHCCEPDEELLQFAKEHRIFIGVDGDVTYWQEKQSYIKRVPLELLVLETDSPYLAPKPYKFPNTPKNLLVITEFVSKLKDIPVKELIEETTQNSMKLFQLEATKKGV